MNGVRRVAHPRIALVIVVAFVVGMALVQGQASASSSGTQVYYTFVDPGQTNCGNPMVPQAREGQLTLFPGAGTPAPILVCVWAKGVTDTAGAAGFNLDFAYENSFVTVSSFVPSFVWLGSTGRSHSCSPLINEPLPAPDLRWRLTRGCVSIGTLPLGPQGGGLLGTLTLTPTGQTGRTDLDHLNSFVTRATADNVIIPTKALDSTILFARCADFSPNPQEPPDGLVSITDIFLVVLNFGTNSATHDLDDDGIVTISDILIAVLEFGQTCPT